MAVERERGIGFLRGEHHLTDTGEPQDDAIGKAAKAAQGRPLVIAVQDAGRTPWMRAALEHLIQGHPDNVFVLCTGIPELAPGETANNNLDDDGNGVTDEAGFNVRRVGDLLTVRLCVQAPFAGNQVTTTRLQTSVVLHN